VKGGDITDDAAVVFAGGDAPPKSVAAQLPDPAFVIAADSGLAHAAALGRRVDLVVGDLDSVDVDALAAAREAGAAVEAHPRDKDQTDLELALDAAVARGFQRIVVAGGHGGRLDHFLANLTLLASPRYTGADVEAWVGNAAVVVVRDQADLVGRPGELVTLVPVGGAARGIRTDGLRYALDDDDLEPGTSRGVSNEFAAERARVTVRTGAVLVIRPDALAPPG
jgi:thiamine pyrophosphokinase